MKKVANKTLQVTDSATVICLRQRKESVGAKLSAADILEGDSNTKGLASMIPLSFPDGTTLDFSCGWEILMGQAEVKNFLKSSPDRVKLMRYPGEFKLAGGNVDPGETIHQAAERELREEFLASLQVSAPSVHLRPFIVKQTRPVKGRSNLMYNYIALESENEWLRDFNVEEVNLNLQRQRETFTELELSGKYYDMSLEEKEKVSPEVHQLQWISLRDAIHLMFGSMLNSVKPINNFQAAEFAKYAVKRRDPMFITIAAVIELEGFPSEAALKQWCEQQDLATLAKEEQWLFDGTLADEAEELVKARLKKNGGLNPSMKTGPMIQKLRAERGMTPKL